MNLTVRERLILLSILPQEGSFITLKIVRQLRESLSFTEGEIKQYKFVQLEGRVEWDNSVEQGKDIPVGDKATDIIASALKDLDTQKKLREEHFDIYLKFVGDK